MENKHPLYIEIQQGESKTLEFKQQLPKGDALAKTLVPFANTAGGKLIIGVDDQRNLVGLGDVDILNIVSPGSLPNGLTMSDVLKGRSEIRNTVIARVFKQLNLVEQWGSGIARIKQYCQDAGVALPTLTETGDFIDWEFPRINTQIVKKNKSQKHPLDNKLASKETDKLGDKLGDRLGDRLGDNRKKMMTAIMKNNTISATELAHIIGISKTAIENNIKWLKEHNYIKRHGSAKAGYWEVLGNGK